MKLKTKILSVLLAAVSLTVAEAQDKPASNVDNLFADPVIARGTGVEIKQSRMDEAIASVKAGAMSRNETINPADMPLLRKKVLDDLLMNQLLNAKATADNKAKGKEEGDKRFELTKKRSVNEETLAKQLKALGLTLDILHARLIEEATAEMVMRSKVNITDDQVKKFYEDHPSDFEQPEMVRANHILLATSDPQTRAPLTDDQKKTKRKLADDLLTRAKAGEDFSKLAREYSEDISVKQNGGEITFARADRNIPVEFSAAAFSLKTNQISDVVTTGFGYHIIKLNEKIPARKEQLTPKISGDIKDYLTRQEIEKMARDYYKSLRKEAKVEILDPQLKRMIEDDDSTSLPPVSPPPQ